VNIVKPKLLLVADAHHSVCEAIRTLLVGLFDAVVTVEDEESLLRAASLTDPDFVVLDFSLSVVDFHDIVRFLRPRGRASSSRVIVLSIYDEPEAAMEVFSAGADALVLKRSAATDLIPAIQEVMAGRSYMSPDVAAQFPCVDGSLNCSHGQGGDQ